MDRRRVEPTEIERFVGCHDAIVSGRLSPSQYRAGASLNQRAADGRGRIRVGAPVHQGEYSGLFDNEEPVTRMGR